MQRGVLNVYVLNPSGQNYISQLSGRICKISPYCIKSATKPNWENMKSSFFPSSCTSTKFIWALWVCGLSRVWTVNVKYSDNKCSRSEVGGGGTKELCDDARTESAAAEREEAAEVYI